MAKQFFKNLPDTTTPLEASRLNGLLDGEEAMGNIVVDSIRSKNMFNKNNFINAYITNTGGITNANSNALFNYIEVEPSTTYTISVNQTINSIMAGEYNSSKTWLARPLANNVSSQTITTSANTKYLRIAINKDNSTTMTQSIIDGLQPQLEKGNVATTYVPYQELDINNIKNETLVVGNIKSKNILNMENTGSQTKNGVSLSYNIDTHILTLNGTASAQTDFTLNNLIGFKLKANTDYVFTNFYVSGTTSGNCPFFLQDSTHSYQGTSVELRQSDFSLHTIYTTDLTFDLALIRVPNGVTLSNYKCQLMIEENTTATNYAPYQDLENKIITERFGTSGNIMNDLKSLSELRQKFPFQANSIKVLPFKTATANKPVNEWGFCIYYWGGDNSTAMCICFGNNSSSPRTYMALCISGTWGNWTQL